MGREVISLGLINDVSANFFPLCDVLCLSPPLQIS